MRGLWWLAGVCAGAALGRLSAPSAEAAPADAALLVSGEAQASWARASLLLHRPVPFRSIPAAAAAFGAVARKAVTGVGEPS